MAMSPTAPVSPSGAIASTTSSTLLLEHPFLQQFLSHYLDGVLIVSDRGETLYANSSAEQLCQQLCPHYSATGTIPHGIASVYVEDLKFERLGTDFLGETEVKQNSLKLRVRAQRIEILKSNKFCILIILEDQRKMMEQIVSHEVHKYSLTPREREVRLLYRLDYSYQEIAHELYISVNTVKKHLKSISVKQRLFLALSDD